MGQNWPPSSVWAQVKGNKSINLSVCINLASLVDFLDLTNKQKFKNILDRVFPKIL